MPGDIGEHFHEHARFRQYDGVESIGQHSAVFRCESRSRWGQRGYAAEFSSDNGSNLTAFVTNGVVDVRWLSWIANTSSISHTGGLAVSITSTNMNTGCDNCSIPFRSQPLVFYADSGKVYAFTNDPNNGIGQLPIVQISDWSADKNTVMTNHLVLNYPARTFSVSLNGVVLTNNMVITPFFTNIFMEVDFGAVEILAYIVRQQVRRG